MLCPNDIDIRRGGDRMVVGFTTTCAISVYKPLKLWARINWPVVLDTTLCDKVCQWIAVGLAGDCQWLAVGLADDCQWLAVGLADDRGKTQSTTKGNDPLPFRIWIFRSGQLDRDDDCRICVAMTST